MMFNTGFFSGSLYCSLNFRIHKAAILKKSDCGYIDDKNNAL